MIDDISCDIELTRKVLTGNANSNIYNIYFETNEYISDILDNFDIKNKTVLTVIGSGDQAFHFYNRGAKKVDLFDINQLAIHYYYLRRWTIIYLGKSYPDYNFDERFLKNILSKVEPKNELEFNSYNYWNSFIDLLNELAVGSSQLFNYSIMKRNENIFDNTNLNNILKNDIFNYYNVDIARKVKIPGKYDIIYTSNISDYVFMTGNFNLYRLNLKKLLKKSGIIISSKLNGFSGIDDEDIMKKSFVYHDLPDVYFTNEEKFMPPGYYYTKK